MRIGVDLGGTKIEIIVLDDNNDELFRQRMPTPKGSYQNTLNAIYKLVKEAVESVKIYGETPTRIGVGTPGAISKKSGRIKNSNSTCLIGRPLQSDLAELTGLEVRLFNDANCFALSEASDGAGRGFKCVFGVILGTGVGGGIVFNGSIIQGRNSIAGEWGHNTLPFSKFNSAQSCYCGKFDCIETFLSGPALEKNYFIASGHSVAAKDIAELAEKNDPLATKVMALYEENLAKALASVINILDPDAIVLGGGISNLSRIYKNVPKIWAKYVFSDLVETDLKKAKHGDSSGVRGAAWLWPLSKK
jgi:fructokinase